MKNLAQIFSLGFVLLACQLAVADTSKPDPQDLINQMSAANRDLNYDGVFMYRMGNQINSMRIIHKADENGISEKLISLTGHAREVVRSNEEVKCYFPEKNAVVIDESRLGKLVSAYLPNPIQSISQFYNFETVGEGRVAGLDTWIVNIRPKDDHRYGYQLWIDKHSKLLLKSELKNQLGVSLEQMMFANININGEIDESLLQPSFMGKEVELINNIQYGQTNADRQKPDWQATWMPAGFTMREHSKQLMMTSKMPVIHMVYSDGLAMVSIFVEKLTKDPDAQQGPSQFGGVNAFSTQVNDYQITAVGEVPKTTVEKMAASVKAIN